MDDKIAVNARKAAYMLLEAGLDFETANKALNAMPQPSKGYFYPSDIQKAIKESK